jgi:GT2 family glycosyltransferase
MICERSRPLASRPTPPPSAAATHLRVRSDGKFFRRGQERLRLAGVSYGPFAANDQGEPFPTPGQAQADLVQIQAAGLNAVRLYHLPPEWFLEQADALGLLLLIDVPWPKHLCFLDSQKAQRQARQALTQTGRRGQDHPCVLAYSLGNEVPANIVRWHGPKAIERFLAELADSLRQVDPHALVTYANYPPTEYLELPFVDFATFNVYLHDREAFGRYLLRLHNRIGPKPLVLGELGLDCKRHGEAAQAQLVAGQVQEALLLGAAGAFVFSFTDDWHTGGWAIDDWAFGLTDRQRRPKPAYAALAEVIKRPLTAQLTHTPRVSVVVCSYNGGLTLTQCLESLLRLDYPDYEVLVIDDGSTDHTPSLASRYPQVRWLRQQNQGLSVARNVGLAAATGEIIAYTDADCFADADWLLHLVYHLQRCDAAGVGGPNLTPADGFVASCVAAAPGQPTQVLESDQVAEHVPGCNMAFRRETLLAVRGFDPAYRKAGDDVDLCWRLQQAGYWITFAPGAFVWHHRRQSPRAYLRQQAGYGEAEALLRFKHPDKFDQRGHGKWRGALYGASARGVFVAGALIYRGTFATGLFQCLYQPGPSAWASLPGTLEWQAAAALVALGGLLWPPLLGLGLGMWLLAVLVAAVQAWQAPLAPSAWGVRGRLLVGWLCYWQPLVRSWMRYHTRLLAYRAPVADASLRDKNGGQLSWRGGGSATYWGEGCGGRLALLERVVAYLNERRWGRALDNGWSAWDVQVHCHPWTVVGLVTAQEDHGGDRVLVRVRYRLRASGYLRLLLGAAVAGLSVALAWGLWTSLVVPALVAFAGGLLWLRGVSRAARVLALVDQQAQTLGMIKIDGHEDLQPKLQEDVQTQL